MALFLPCCYTLIYLYTTIPLLFHPSVLLSSLVSSYKKRSSFPDHNLVFYCLKNTRQMFITASSSFLGKNSGFWAKPTVALLFLSPATSSSTKTDSSYCKEQHRWTVQAIHSLGEFNSSSPPEAFLICFSNTFFSSKSCLWPKKCR